MVLQQLVSAEPWVYELDLVSETDLERAKAPQLGRVLVQLSAHVSGQP